jgi:FkbH-like protein
VTAPALDALLGGGKPADYLRAARAIRAGALDALRPLRVGLLGSCTLQFLEPYLVVEGARRGFRLEPYFGPFGQFEQEIGDPASGLNAAAPEALVLLLRPEDVDPDLPFRPRAGAAAATLDAQVRRLAGCVETFRRTSAAPVLVANFALPATLPLGVFDANAPESLAAVLARAGDALRDALGAHAGAAVWDYAGLVAAHGAAAWTDRRLWALARVPVAAAMQPSLAAHLVRSLAGLLRPPAKCVVVDLDNTLWGGVIGDDGLTGIQLGDDHPGSAFKAFQRALLGLRDRGILVAVASKNEPETVEQAFREHPEMLLRHADIAAMRVNWEPKSGNLRAIARELNIGADALVFFDDNPVERAEVRANAPEVGVIEVPADPLQYVGALLDSGWFDQPSLSAEDRERARMYAANAERQALETRAGSVEEFLASLRMTAAVGEADAATLGRIAQLVGKTNQFNLTTRRHAQADLAAMAADPRRVVAWLRLRDAMGDQGLVCVAVLAAEGADARIDTFLMSCRVMNRRVEHAMLAFLAEHARRLGCHRLVGDYLPTPKNGMVRDFYAAAGFAPDAAHDGEGTRWTLSLEPDSLAWPALIGRDPAGAALPAETLA